MLAGEARRRFLILVAPSHLYGNESLCRGRPVRNLLRIGGASKVVASSIIMRSPRSWEKVLLGAYGHSYGHNSPWLLTVHQRSPQGHPEIHQEICCPQTYPHAQREGRHACDCHSRDQAHAFAWFDPPFPVSDLQTISFEFPMLFYHDSVNSSVRADISPQCLDPTPALVGDRSRIRSL